MQELFQCLYGLVTISALVVDFGGAGDDELSGGKGIDTLAGGGGFIVRTFKR